MYLFGLYCSNRVFFVCALLLCESCEESCEGCCCFAGDIDRQKYKLLPILYYFYNTIIIHSIFNSIQDRRRMRRRMRFIIMMSRIPIQYIYVLIDCRRRPNQINSISKNQIHSLLLLWVTLVLYCMLCYVVPSWR